VRSLSQHIGYTDRSTRAVRTVNAAEIREALVALCPGGVMLNGSFTQTLVDYFLHRAHVLNEQVRPNLMDAKEAARLFLAVRRKLNSKTPVPMNKQKGKKRKPAFFTGIINMLIDAHRAGMTCDFDPLRLTSVVRDGGPLRTLARRVDGAFPGTVNPVAIWEIKEYYYTKTFGSRVADGVYETLLDGMELEELAASEGIKIRHYLFVDDRFTWWECGRSYLCRIIDMLHMGYVDEVLFGREVVERLPVLVKEWRTAVE
jgi:hypothetical protein